MAMAATAPNSEIAGCTRFAAKEKPKKNIYRDDWA
jgi:hypothetical protein